MGHLFPSDQALTISPLYNLNKFIRVGPEGWLSLYSLSLRVCLEPTMAKEDCMGQPSSTCP